MSEPRRITKFKDRDDGMVERWVGREGGPLTLDSVFDLEEFRPRHEDAYHPGGEHIADCRVIPFGPDTKAGFVKCAGGCPELARTLERANEIVRQHPEWSWPGMSEVSGGPQGDREK